MQDEEQNRDESQYQNDEEGEKDLLLLEIQGGGIPGPRQPAEHYFVNTATAPPSNTESSDSHDDLQGDGNYHERQISCVRDLREGDKNTDQPHNGGAHDLRQDDAQGDRPESADLDHQRQGHENIQNRDSEGGHDHGDGDENGDCTGTARNQRRNICTNVNFCEGDFRNVIHVEAGDSNLDFRPCGNGDTNPRVSIPFHQRRLGRAGSRAPPCAVPGCALPSAMPDSTNSGDASSQTGFHSLLELPLLPAQNQRPQPSQPLIDYSQSIILTSDEYLASMEAKAKKREETRIESDRRKQETACKRQERDLQRRRKEAEKGNVKLKVAPKSSSGSSGPPMP